jgi:hypothetical protein
MELSRFCRQSRFVHTPLRLFDCLGLTTPSAAGTIAFAVTAVAAFFFVPPLRLTVGVGFIFGDLSKADGEDKATASMKA